MCQSDDDQVTLQVRALQELTIQDKGVGGALNGYAIQSAVPEPSSAFGAAAALMVQAGLVRWRCR